MPRIARSKSTSPRRGEVKWARWQTKRRTKKRRTRGRWVLHILVLGAAGMVGRKLTERLLRDGRLGGREISRMTLHDVVAPMKPADAAIPISIVTSDFAEPGTAATLLTHRPDVIFHLAA